MYNYNDSQVPFSTEGGTFLSDISSTGSFSKALEELQQSGMYWRNLARKEAESILKSTNRGDFLIRDSTSTNTLLTLSFKSNRKVLHVRIMYRAGKFSLESEHQQKQHWKFDSIVSMVEHYVARSISKMSAKLVASRTLQEDKLFLLRPVKRTCSSLQHLCRVKLNDMKDKTASSGLQSNLSKSLREYVEQYPYTI
eukprot:gene9187-10161_t